MDPIAVTLKAIGKDANEAAFRAMVEGAKEIRDRAREYAPVDDVELAPAIIEEHRKAELRASVGIDLDAADHKGKQIAEYGWIMHEALGPHGSGAFHLGEKSRAKDAGRGVVGGKFLERSYKELARGIVNNVAFAVKRIFRG